MKQVLLYVVVLVSTLSIINSELLPSLELKPTGYVSFKNETKSRTHFNIFSLYVKLGSTSEDRQHIISIRSQSRSEQFIKVSLMQMTLSIVANLRDPPVERWFMVGEKLVPDEVYFIKVDQNGTAITTTINDVTEKHQLETVEDFIFPAEIFIGKMASAGTIGINGSIAGLNYNGVNTFDSYLRRDDDFKNVAVELGGGVTVREKDWVTIDERNNRYCPKTNHFPKSIVGTEIRTEHCQQNIARAVCGENQIWLIEKCGVPGIGGGGMEDGEQGKYVKNRSDDTDEGSTPGGGLSRNYLIICIVAGTGAILLVAIIIVAVIVKRNKRHRVHRYEMTKALDYNNDYNNFPHHRLQGISTLPPLKHDSLTSCARPNPRPSSLEMSYATLDNPGSDILDSRVPVFRASANPLIVPTPSELYPNYLTGEATAANGDSDIIGTILGERVERNYSNQLFNGSQLMPAALLNSNSGLTSEQSWQDV